MNTAVAAVPNRDGPAAGALLLAGIVLATLTEAIAGTALSLGRIDLIGDTHATPDEFAWLDVGYVTLKFVGFLFAPWLMSRIQPRDLIVGCTLAMGVACGLAVLTTHLDLLILLRSAQGIAGGILLVAGQAVVFLAWPLSRQPMLQALFATGAVVAPATLAPALQGWMLDSHSWTWIFSSVVPLALAAAGLLLLADTPAAKSVRRPFDWIGLSLVWIALFCLTYVLGQGSRWDWFGEPRLVWLTVTGVLALLAFIGHQMMVKEYSVLDFGAFRSPDFAFAFVVSFVAGAALFGSAYLIPSFAVAVLAFTPTDAGLLLLPSSALFIAALLVAAWLMQFRRLPPIATVPFGIGAIMLAMWMLSGSTSESGAADMMAAILLRGLGLGFLFLPITLIAFGRLDSRTLASGIALFNTGRQLGGLMGVAWLQTLIDHGVAANIAAIGASVNAGAPALTERLAASTAMLAAKGLDTAAAGRAATGLLGRAVTGQSTVIAFDTAFVAVALLFVAAAPVIIALKIGLSRRARSRRARTMPENSPVLTPTRSSPAACR